MDTIIVEYEETRVTIEPEETLVTVEPGKTTVIIEPDETTVTVEPYEISVTVEPEGPQGEPGIQGEPGPQGNPGEIGPPGSSAYQVAVNNGFVGTEEEWLASLHSDTLHTYVHQQITPSATWNITHDLYRRPSVTIVNSAGETVWGKVEYLSLSEVVVYFRAPFSGEAYLN